jgi:hypothetical protein
MSFITDQLGDSYKEGMSEDEVSALLEKVWAAKEKEHAKTKSALDKTSSDVAKLKKELGAHQTEEEKAKSAQEAEIERLRAENEQFKKASAINEITGKLIGLGYADTLAAETAEALYNSDMDTFFANTRTMLTDLEKNIKAGVMKGAPTPRPSEGATAMTKEEIMKIRDSEERQMQIAAHRDLFGL